MHGNISWLPFRYEDHSKGLFIPLDHRLSRLRVISLSSHHPRRKDVHSLVFWFSELFLKDQVLVCLNSCVVVFLLFFFVGNATNFNISQTMGSCLIRLTTFFPLTELPFFCTVLTKKCIFFGDQNGKRFHTYYK